MLANKVVVHRTESFGGRIIFLIVVDERPFFAAIRMCEGRKDRHFCAYLMVPKDEWIQIADENRHYWGITFEGISSNELMIPHSVEQAFNMMENTRYWIGVDYMEQAIQPTPEEAADRITRIAVAYVDTLKRLAPVRAA